MHDIFWVHRKYTISPPTLCNWFCPIFQGESPRFHSCSGVLLCCCNEKSADFSFGLGVAKFGLRGSKNHINAGLARVWRATQSSAEVVGQLLVSLVVTLQQSKLLTRGLSLAGRDLSIQIPKVMNCTLSCQVFLGPWSAQILSEDYLKTTERLSVKKLLR